MKFDAIAIFAGAEGAERIHHDCLDETFHSLVKIPSRRGRVLPDKFMGSGVGRQELCNCHPIDENFFLARLVCVGDVLFL